VTKNVCKKMEENGSLCPWLEEEYGGSNAGYEYSVVINGQETFISNGINCDFVIGAVKRDTKADPPFKGISLICVEAGTPGFEKSRNLDKMGFHSQDTSQLNFVDCRVPVTNLLGKEGQGFSFLMKKLQGERLIASVMAQSMAEAMLQMIIKYSQERTVFGKPISSFQQNTFKIVEMATEIVWMPTIPSSSKSVLAIEISTL
jgi:acyl-CoA dehydrogenase